jgi:hypothetical protein
MPIARLDRLGARWPGDTMEGGAPSPCPPSTIAVPSSKPMVCRGHERRPHERRVSHRLVVVRRGADRVAGDGTSGWRFQVPGQPRFHDRRGRAVARHRSTIAAQPAASANGTLIDLVVVPWNWVRCAYAPGSGGVGAVPDVYFLGKGRA